MRVRVIKTTREDRKYFDEKAKITQAAKEGKLGKEWLFKNPVNGKWELRPKRIYNKVT